MALGKHFVQARTICVSPPLPKWDNTDNTNKRPVCHSSNAIMKIEDSSARPCGTYRQ